MFTLFSSLICGSLLLVAGRHKSIAIKPPRFYTLDKNGNTILTEVSAPPPLDIKKTRRADGMVDIAMEIHSKEQAVEVLAALETMYYEEGAITAADYQCNVHKIREHFNL